MCFVGGVCSDCFNSFLTFEAGDVVAQLGCPHSCFAMTRADRHNVGFPVSLFPQRVLGLYKNCQDINERDGYCYTRVDLT